MMSKELSRTGSCLWRAMLLVLTIPFAAGAQGGTYRHTTFVHGFGGSSGVWTGIRDALQSRSALAVLAEEQNIDLAWKHTPYLSSGLRIEAQGDLLTSDIAGNAGGHLLVGHSLGGVVIRDAFHRYDGVRSQYEGVVAIGSPLQGADVAVHLPRAQKYAGDLLRFTQDANNEMHGKRWLLVAEGWLRQRLGIGGGTMVQLGTCGPGVSCPRVDVTTFMNVVIVAFADLTLDRLGIPEDELQQAIVENFNQPAIGDLAPLEYKGRNLPPRDPARYAPLRWDAMERMQIAADQGVPRASVTGDLSAKRSPVLYSGLANMGRESEYGGMLESRKLLIGVYNDCENSFAAVLVSGLRHRCQRAERVWRYMDIEWQRISMGFDSVEVYRYGCRTMTTCRFDHYWDERPRTGPTDGLIAGYRSVFPGAAAQFVERVPDVEHNGLIGRPAGLAAVARAMRALRARPAFGVTIAGPSSGVAYSSYTFTATARGGLPDYRYAWKVDGTPVSGATASSLRFTPTTSGVKQVEAVVTDANDIVVSQPSTFVVSDPPPLQVSMSRDGDAIAGSMMTFNAWPAGGVAPYRYAWSINGVVQQSATSASLAWTPPSAGTYSIVVTVTDAINHSNSAADAVSVSPAPPACNGVLLSNGVCVEESGP